VERNRHAELCSPSIAGSLLCHASHHAGERGGLLRAGLWQRRLEGLSAQLLARLMRASDVLLRRVGRNEG